MLKLETKLNERLSTIVYGSNKYMGLTLEGKFFSHPLYLWEPLSALHDKFSTIIV